MHSCRFNSLQGKQLVILIVLALLTFLVVYSRFESEISRLDEARKKLAHTVARLQLQNDDGTHGAHNDLYAARLQNSELDLPDFTEETVIIYNRVPKTGSTSFMGVAYDLCTENGFHVLHINTTKNSHVLSLSDQMRFVYNVTTWSAKKPSLYHGHVAFLDFSRFGTMQKPLFINIIRKPLDRLVSYYYFLRYGDNFRPYLIRRRQGDKMTFDECIEQKERDCDPDSMWLQIPFFCGHVADCWVSGSQWALQQAKHNLVHNYLLVGVTEELPDFISLLEFTLPHFFNGATKLFTEGKKSHLRKTFNKSDPTPETVAKIQKSKVWQMEQEFYEFALQNFHFVKKRTLTFKNGQVMDKGQQFTYEKIRPK